MRSKGNVWAASWVVRKKERQRQTDTETEGKAGSRR